MRDILCWFPLALPFLLAIGGYLDGGGIAGALFFGALGLSVPAVWFSCLQTRGELRRRQVTTVKGFLWRAAIFLVATLSLLIPLVLFTWDGLAADNVWLVAVGFLSASICCVVFVTVLVKGVGVKGNPLVFALLGTAIATGLQAWSVSSWVEVAPACKGQPVVEAAPYGGSGPHRLKVLREGEPIGHSVMPADWQAESAKDTELVACIGPPERYVIHICRYHGGPNVTRYGHRRTVTLVIASTGETLASRTFEGEPPRKCQEKERRSLEKLVGSRSIDMDEVRKWLSAYVVPDLAAVRHGDNSRHAFPCASW